MPAGKVHNQFNVFFLIVCLIFYFIVYKLRHLDYVVCYSVFFMIGTFFLSPDLDLENTKPQNKWRKYKILVIPYADIFKHRGLSHKILIGTLTRVFYFVVLFSILTIVFLITTNYLCNKKASFNYQYNLLFTQIKLILQFMLGFIVYCKYYVITALSALESSAICHYFLDFKGGK